MIRRGGMGELGGIALWRSRERDSTRSPSRQKLSGGGTRLVLISGRSCVEPAAEQCRQSDERR